MGNIVHGKRSLMSKMLNTFLLKYMVIIHNLNMSELILNTESDGYQALYNILVHHHPNISTNNKVQTELSAHRNNERFATHLKHVRFVT